MKDIVFTLEFDGIDSNERANEYLQKGWILLHVGKKLVNSFEPADYETAYVVGANAEQYAEYQKEQEEDMKNDEFYPKD